MKGHQQNPIVKHNVSIAKDILNNNKNLTTVNIKLDKCSCIKQSTIITPITIDINSIPITSVKNGSSERNGQTTTVTAGRTIRTTSGPWVRAISCSPSKGKRIW
ncbi:hypothetical protein [Fictibacillus enclensis]|uniref:hypothetical protein n=1 Tax=Fictibacillus enclensis TaxID=1017270 RepID=UPI0024C061EE|nr:hypothetical protein [Fictibacillus enclensis]WHY70614.1 hypothetical protein QNH15_16365 [Fictibacillus enclensis]